MKYKILAIIGESGTGKDTLMKSVLSKNKNLHEIISFTTRPPRDYEEDGVNYHFISKDEFGQKLLNGEMLEASCFNDWFYGTGYGSLSPDRINIGVFNPDGIDAIKMNRDIDLVVFYVRAKDKTRLIRQLNRVEDPDIEEIFRRFKTDIEDFDDLKFYYNEIWNENEDDLKKNIKILNSAVRMLEAKTE